jgi:hypothetical protein
MKIIVAIKQVPERDAQVAVAADGKWIEESDLSYTINEPDAYALPGRTVSPRPSAKLWRRELTGRFTLRRTILPPATRCRWLSCWRMQSALNHLT